MDSNTTPFVDYMTANKQQPRVVVAFVADQLSSAAALRNAEIKNVAHVSGASSLVIPHTKVHGSRSVSKNIESVFGPSKEYRMDAGNCAESTNWVKDALKQDSTSYVLVMRFKNAAHVDACVQDVTNLVNTHTEGDYLSVFSAEKGSSVRRQFSSTSLADIQSVKALGLAAAPVKSNKKSARVGGGPTWRRVGPQYVNSVTVVALFLMFCFIFTLYVGIYSLMSIETPVRFSYANLAISKEY